MGTHFFYEVVVSNGDMMALQPREAKKVKQTPTSLEPLERTEFQRIEFFRVCLCGGYGASEVRPKNVSWATQKKDT